MTNDNLEPIDSLATETLGNDITVLVSDRLLTCFTDAALRNRISTKAEVKRELPISPVL